MRATERERTKYKRNAEGEYEANIRRGNDRETKKTSSNNRKANERERMEKAR